MTRRVGFGGSAPRRKGPRRVGEQSAPPKTLRRPALETPRDEPTGPNRMRAARLLARSAVLAGLALVIALLALLVIDGVRRGEPSDDGATAAAGLALAATTIGWLALFRAFVRDLMNR